MSSQADGVNPNRKVGVAPAGIDFDELATSLQLTESVTSVAGVRALAPGLRDLVATATAKVLRRAGGEPVGVDVTSRGEGVNVRIDAHLDASRSVAAIVDEICAVVEAGVATGAVDAAGAGVAPGQLEIDLRVVSRSPSSVGR